MTSHPRTDRYDTGCFVHCYTPRSHRSCCGRLLFATMEWNTYTGTVTWWVTVTEDQSACSGPVLTNRYSVPIQFNAGSAVMGDVGHGSAGGMFTSDNILHIDGRTVVDPPGESALSPYDVQFSPDCSAFTAKYTWAYTGSDGNCDGSTSLSGRIASDSCPASGCSYAYSHGRSCFRRISYIRNCFSP